MLVPFIATIVIILIIAGLLSQQTLIAKGAESQTDSMKAVVEITQIAKAADYYKITHRDFSGISASELVKLGIIKNSNVATTAADGEYIYDKNDNSGEGNVPANRVFIVSKVYPENVGYIIEANADDPDILDITIIVKPQSGDGSLTAEERHTLESAVVSNLGGHVIVNNPADNGSLYMQFD